MNHDNRNKIQDSSRRIVNVEETSSKAMVAIDGAGFDWSFMAEEEVATNMALMAFQTLRFYNVKTALHRSQISDNSRKGVGYNVVPPPPTGLFAPPTIDLVQLGLEIVPQPAQSTIKRPYQSKTVLTNKRFTQKVNTAKAKAVNTARPHSAVVNVVKDNQANGNPPTDDQGYVDSGCSRHMTGNISYLSNFQEFDGGYVTFGRGVRGGNITGKGTLRTGKLDFQDLPDESQILLKITRKNNMYSVDMKNIVPKESLTCLVVKATLDESMLWHRRLGHVYGSGLWSMVLSPVASVIHSSLSPVVSLVGGYVGHGHGPWLVVRGLWSVVVVRRSDGPSGSLVGGRWSVVMVLVMAWSVVRGLGGGRGHGRWSLVGGPWSMVGVRGSMFRGLSRGLWSWSWSMVGGYVRGRWSCPWLVVGSPRPLLVDHRRLVSMKLMMIVEVNATRVEVNAVDIYLALLNLTQAKKSDPFKSMDQQWSWSWSVVGGRGHDPWSLVRGLWSMVMVHGRCSCSWSVVLSMSVVRGLWSVVGGCGCGRGRGRGRGPWSLVYGPLSVIGGWWSVVGGRSRWSWLLGEKVIKLLLELMLLKGLLLLVGVSTSNVFQRKIFLVVSAASTEVNADN
ncbi:hypothetical protein Tco_0174331 [Tanacetum coccineum]